MPIFLRLLIVGLCFYCRQGIAQSHQNPVAHTHGLARMTVLYEAGQLLIELETPAANMLGFQHSPQNTEQWRQLSQLKKSLNAPENIIGLKPSCMVQRVDVRLPFQEREEAKIISVQPTAEKPAHHEQPEDAHKGYNDAKSRYNETSQDVHQDFYVSYAWHCIGPTPPIIQVHLFSLHPSFEKIQAQWVGISKQGTKTLYKNHAALEIKPCKSKD